MWLLALMIVYVGVYGTLSIVKHNNFHSFILDLGIMAHVTWNTAHGWLFETTVSRAMNNELVGSYLGNHVRPFLLLLAPFYRLWPDPRMLLVVQTIALGIGAIPLFWIARRELKRPILHYVLAIVYLAYPALGFINLFDFHPVAFCVPAFLFAYWALLEERPVLFWSMILLTLSTKEELVVPVAAFGVYCLFKPKWRQKGIGLVGISMVWAVLCFAVIIPTANEGKMYRFFDLWSPLLSWVGLGNCGQQGPPTSGMAPFSVDAAYFVVHLLLPLGFLPLLSPGLFAISLPSFAYLLLSTRTALHTVGFQYPAVLIPWLFLATVKGLGKIERWLRVRRVGGLGRWLPVVVLLVGTVGANLPFNPIFTSWRSGYFMRLPHQEQIEHAMALIPPQAGVATINPLGPHLVNRRVLISLEKYTSSLDFDHLAHADYVLVDLVDCRLFHTPHPREDYNDMLLAIVDSGEFGVRYQSGRILLLERGIQIDPGKLEDVEQFIIGLEEDDRPCWP